MLHRILRSLSKGIYLLCKISLSSFPLFAFLSSLSPSASFDTGLTVMVIARPTSTATIRTMPDAAREAAGSLRVRKLETFSCNDFGRRGSDGEALV